MMVWFMRSIWPVVPRVLGFGRVVIDVIEGEGGFKSMSPEDISLLSSQLDIGGRRTGVTEGMKGVPLSLRTVWIRQGGDRREFPQ